MQKRETETDFDIERERARDRERESERECPGGFTGVTHTQRCFGTREVKHQKREEKRDGIFDQCVWTDTGIDDGSADGKRDGCIDG